MPPIQSRCLDKDSLVPFSVFRAAIIATFSLSQTSLQRAFPVTRGLAGSRSDSQHDER